MVLIRRPHSRSYRGQAQPNSTARVGGIGQESGALSPGELLAGQASLHGDLGAYRGSRRRPVR